jgi:transcriptional regulator with XRE-family HTH domain
MEKLYRVRELAEARGISNQRQLMIAANISNQTTQRLWRGHGTVTTDSLERVAKALQVSIVELFEGYCNGHNEKEGKEVVESGNKEPVLVGQFTTQQARVSPVVPTVAQQLSSQSRVPLVALCKAA